MLLGCGYGNRGWRREARRERKIGEGDKARLNFQEKERRGRRVKLSLYVKSG